MKQLSTYLHKNIRTITMFGLLLHLIILLPTTHSFQHYGLPLSTHRHVKQHGRHPSLTFTTKTTLSSSKEQQDDEETKNPFDEIYDLAVIGAGPVGVQAAVIAASPPQSKRVCLIDAPLASGALYDHATSTDLSIGGPTGLFSKALRDTSKRISIDTLRGMGLREDSCWNEIVSSCIDLAGSSASDVRRQLNFVGVTYIEGFASFALPDTEDEDDDDDDDAPPNALCIATTNKEGETKTSTLRANKILIATGSSPFRPAGIPFDGKRIFDSDSINTLSYLPRSIAITGSGIIAIEFAKIFRNLGAEVTLIIRDNVPRNALMKIGLDKDISATLVADLVRSGIKIERGAQVASFDIPQNNMAAPIKITLEGRNGSDRPTGSKMELKVDSYLAAVGRQPNTQKLNLEKAGIELDEYGGIQVNSNLQTTAKGGNVYGAGDVLGRPFLASTGVAQGIAAVKNMFGNQDEEEMFSDNCDASNENELCVDGDLSSTGAKFDPTSLAANPYAFPIGVWTSPEAAYYGLSTQQALELGIDASEGIALYCECLRGLVFSPNGLLKLVYEKTTGRVLGVHICGNDACELIHYGMELVKAKRTINDIVENVFSAVTFHEMYRIAAMAAMDEKGARKRRAAAGAALAAQNRAKKVVD
mmetsp:Transcript_13860/g.20521  ORF Transcript_13860/g.20521 Transcript_13860/m.20521 type:complete len:645 (+) Transcript_13860:54-1988(+)